MHLPQLSIWRSGLSILEIDTQLNSIKIKWIQRLLNPTNALWKDLILYQLLNAWLHFTNNKFPTRASIEEILDQPIFLNSHTKLDFSSNKPYFYCFPPTNISDKFTII